MNNSNNLTLGKVKEVLNGLKISTSQITIQELSTILKIDTESAKNIYDGLMIHNISVASEYFDEMKEKVSKKDDRGALECLNKAIEFNPNQGIYYRERGFLRFLLKDSIGALSDLTKAKEYGFTDLEIDSVIEICNHKPKVKQKKEGCYIATSIYGNYNAAEVIVLRNFRDLFLKKYLFGRIFIAIYYFISPSIVKATRNIGFVNIIIKKCLDMLIRKIKE